MSLLALEGPQLQELLTDLGTSGSFQSEVSPSQQLSCSERMVVNLSNHMQVFLSRVLQAVVCVSPSQTTSLTLERGYHSCLPAL